MRSLKIGSLVLGALGLVIGGAACGDDTGVGGSGGSGGNATTTTATTTTGTTTTTTGTTVGSTSTGTTGMCAEVSVTLANAGAGAWQGEPDAPLGGAGADFVNLFLADGMTGMQTFSVPANLNDCFETAACVLILEDIDEGTGIPAKVYLADSGSVDLGATTGPFYIAGSLAGVHLVEVDLDFDTLDVTPIQAGACANLANQSFQFDPPVAGWTCAPDYYAGGDGCDCGCGAVDTDCADALVATCDYCDDTGSCNADECPGTINATNNAVCN